METYKFKIINDIHCLFFLLCFIIKISIRFIRLFKKYILIEQKVNTKHLKQIQIFTS